MNFYLILSLFLLLTIIVIFAFTRKKEKMSLNCKVTKNRKQLHDEYFCIFRTGNRNSASHKWSKHLFNISHNLTRQQFVNQFQSFCPVSGSPIGENAATYKINLKNMELFLKKFVRLWQLMSRRN